MIPRRRPLTIARRRKIIVRAAIAIAASSEQWPLERDGLGELGEALALLDFVIRQLDD